MKSVLTSILFFLSLSNALAATITIDDGEDLYVTLDSKSSEMVFFHLRKGLYACTKSDFSELAQEINKGDWQLSDYGMTGAKVLDSSRIEFFLWELANRSVKIELEQCQ